MYSQFCYRLNPDLCEFVSTIYSRAFKPQKVQAQQVATRLKSLNSIIGANHGSDNGVLKDVQMFLLALSDAMLQNPQTILHRPRQPSIFASPCGKPDNTHSNDIGSHQAISLALIRLHTCTGRSTQIEYEDHLRAEAATAAAVVSSIRHCFPEDDIFVATPRRLQKNAVNAALLKNKRSEEDRLIDAMNDMSLLTKTSSNVESGKVTVDTVERLQGQYPKYAPQQSVDKPRKQDLRRPLLSAFSLSHLQVRCRPQLQMLASFWTAGV